MCDFRESAKAYMTLIVKGYLIDHHIVPGCF